MLIRGNKSFNKRTMLRLSYWGLAAVLALAMTAVVGFSTSGSQRAAMVFAALTGSAPPAQVSAQASPRSDLESETRRLNEAIRLLAADRDRLLTRVASIEHSLEDVTGSINRQSAMSQPSDGNLESALPPKASALEMGTPGAFSAGSRSAALPDAPEWMANTPAPWPSPSVAVTVVPTPEASQVGAAPVTMALANENARTTPASKTEFGVDIGSAQDLDTLRAMWNQTRARYPALLSRLHPIFSVQEGTPELRLIIGPLPNASAAARLCAALGAGDILCSARVFEGQRFALR
ncbi:MAG: hypothetical protein QOD40_2529 [Alphaproteobacteria bacterium]|jgi:hypothetical protein|nr:hypothetical protein [Alphaproteobacteria bacterium]